METKISVKDLMMQAFLTGWELSDKSISQDEYLQSSIDVIEVLQVEPENVYAEEGFGLPDGEEVDHLDDLLRADGQWLYYGVEEENFFLIQWYPDVESANAKLAELEAMACRHSGKIRPAPRSAADAGVYPAWRCDDLPALQKRGAGQLLAQPPLSSGGR